MTQFKVLQCASCGTLTYKRLDFKMVRCPRCQAKMTGEPMQIFENAREAMKFIQGENMKHASQSDEWFETFE